MAQFLPFSGTSRVEKRTTATTLSLLVGRHPAHSVAARGRSVREFDGPASGTKGARSGISLIPRFVLMEQAAGALAFIWFGMHVDRFRRAHRGSVLRGQPIGCLLCASVLSAICLHFYSCLRLFPSDSPQPHKPCRLSLFPVRLHMATL